MGFFTVIGLGRFGNYIALELEKNGADVLAIDMDEKLVEAIADQVTRAAVADARNKDALRGLGVADCDCAVVAIGSDLASSVLATMNLKALGVKKVVCKAFDSLHKEILEKLGADRVIIPEQQVAENLAVNLVSPDVLNYISFSTEYGILELEVPREWVGKSLRELKVRTRYNVNLIALRSGDAIQISMDPDRKMEPDDVLVLLGSYPSLEKLKTL